MKILMYSIYQYPLYSSVNIIDTSNNLVKHIDNEKTKDLIDKFEITKQYSADARNYINHTLNNMSCDLLIICENDKLRIFKKL